METLVFKHARTIKKKITSTYTQNKTDKCACKREFLGEGTDWEHIVAVFCDQKGKEGIQCDIVVCFVETHARAFVCLVVFFEVHFIDAYFFLKGDDANDRAES